MGNEYSISAMLAEKASDGDWESFAQLYHSYKQGMFSICFRMTGNKADAEDVLQNAFEIAFKNIRALRDKQLFSKWLRTITINECIRFSKTQMRICETDKEIFLLEDDSNSLETWQGNFNLQEIQEAIKKLPDGLRQVFVLYAVEDYSHKQIGDMLKITEVNSKVRYSRAKKILQILLKR